MRYEAQWRGVVAGIPEEQHRQTAIHFFIKASEHNMRGVMTEHENESSNSSPGAPDHDTAGAHDHNADNAEQDQIAKYRLKLEQTADLVARIRHEINNPLTGVLGQAQLLLREDLSERSRKRVKTIEDLALRLRDVVAQLREVQRPGGEGETNGSAD